tara:strand:+ start:620 stop:943 length:324 start_codon:yes stop_codon:yes gene_type:complete
MDKHTPGPWSIKEVLEGIFLNGYYWAMQGRRLSEEKNQWKHYVQNTAYINYEANARLMAASPMLLEALEEVVNDIENYCDDWNSGSPTDVTVVLPKLRAAIAEAKGE